MNSIIKTVAVIVAHPDDETLWAGGTILNNPGKRYFVACLCRKKDPDRAPRFEKAVKILGADGAMGDLDDGPEQAALRDDEPQKTILQLLPSRQFDLVITHSIYGEYTRHRRHEETGKAAINLWYTGKLNITELWTFAYEDGNRAYYPAAIKGSPVFYVLTDKIWKQKHNLITNIYGFKKNSWEAQTTPKQEAFRQFYNAEQAHEWLLRREIIP